MEINKNNGVAGVLTENSELLISKINYFGTNFSTQNNTLEQVLISRDETGNIISYLDTEKNKTQLLIPQITNRFNPDTLRYSLDYQFKEFFSQENIIESLSSQINDLKADIDLLMGNVKGKDDVISQLKQSDLDKQRQIEASQKVIDNLTKQAVDIANKLAEQMNNASKTSADALSKLTDDLSKQIKDLKSDVEKEKAKDEAARKETESALDKIRRERDLQNQRANDNGISQDQGGTPNDFVIGTLDELGITVPTPVEKEKTNSGTQITINKDPNLFGNTVSAALGKFETRVNDDRKNAPVIANPTAKDIRNKNVLNKTNDLLIEIAIGDWYKYYKKEVSMTEGVFKRREISHRGRLQNDNIDKVTGQKTGAIINNLTNTDIAYLLERVKDYYKEVPYTQIYSQGIPYTDAEQANFEKLYPGMKGQRQKKTPPPHFLYALNIFDIPLVRDIKNNYVKI